MQHTVTYSSFIQTLTLLTLCSFPCASALRSCSPSYTPSPSLCSLPGQPVGRTAQGETWFGVVPRYKSQSWVARLNFPGAYRRYGCFTHCTMQWITLEDTGRLVSCGVLPTAVEQAISSMNAANGMPLYQTSAQLFREFGAMGSSEDFKWYSAFQLSPPHSAFQLSSPFRNDCAKPQQSARPATSRACSMSTSHIWSVLSRVVRENA